MSMTKNDINEKRKIEGYLIHDGHPRFAKLLNKFFHLNVTYDPNIFIFTEENKSVPIIVINAEILEDLQLTSILIRCEILKEFLNQEAQLRQHISSDLADELENSGHTNLKNRKLTIRDIMDIAKDYDVSNISLTDADKNYLKTAQVRGTRFLGLITEMSHPDWISKSLTEIYDLLLKEIQDKENKAKLKTPKNKVKADNITLKDGPELLGGLSFEEETSQQEIDYINDVLPKIKSMTLDEIKEIFLKFEFNVFQPRNELQKKLYEELVKRFEALGEELPSSEEDYGEEHEIETSNWSSNLNGRKPWTKQYEGNIDDQRSKSQSAPDLLADDDSDYEELESNIPDNTDPDFIKGWNQAIADIKAGRI